MKVGQDIEEVVEVTSGVQGILQKLSSSMSRSWTRKALVDLEEKHLNSAVVKVPPSGLSTDSHLQDYGALCWLRVCNSTAPLRRFVFFEILGYFLHIHCRRMEQEAGGEAAD